MARLAMATGGLSGNDRQVGCRSRRALRVAASPLAIDVERGQQNFFVGAVHRRLAIFAVVVVLPGSADTIRIGNRRNGVEMMPVRYCRRPDFRSIAHHLSWTILMTIWPG